MPMVPTFEGLDLDPNCFPFESEGEKSAHNPLVMPSSMPERACTKEPKSVYGKPMRCLV